MSEEILCSGCEEPLAVPVGAAGKALKCPVCGTRNPVPAAEPPARSRPAAVRDEPDEDEEDRPRPRRRRRDARPRHRKAGVPAWLWALGGTFAVVLLLLGVFVSMRRDRDAQPPHAGADPQSPLQVNGPGVPPPAPGEVLPDRWERVSLPGTKMTMLMPQGAAPAWVYRGNTWLTGGRQVNRGLNDPDDENGDILFTAGYIEAQKPANVVVPESARAEIRPITVAGYPAQMFIRGHSGAMDRAHLRIIMGENTFIEVAVTGKGVTWEQPYVKRAMDSISFTLPAKAGPPIPVDYDPAWTRRFATGQPFSVELPGRVRKPKETGDDRPRTLYQWGTEGQLPRRDKNHVSFVVAATGNLSTPPTDPRKRAEQVIDFHAKAKRPSDTEAFGRYELGGLPGHVRASTSPHGRGEVEIIVYDSRLQYTYRFTGDGITPDSPEVKRCLGSVSFTTPPPGK